MKIIVNLLMDIQNKLIINVYLNVVILMIIIGKVVVINVLMDVIMVKQEVN